MKKPKLRLAAGEIGHRIVKIYIDKNGVECVDVEYTDGERMPLKIYDPNDPFWKECKRDLADLPPLNFDQIISELREERI